MAISLLLLDAGVSKCESCGSFRLLISDLFEESISVLGPMVRPCMTFRGGPESVLRELPAVLRLWGAYRTDRKLADERLFAGSRRTQKLSLGDYDTLIPMIVK
jgi:hypothetical protein